MKHINLLTSACRYCRYYQPEGRRGGVCQQLGAPVRGNWKACSLALPPFAPSWESLKDAWMSDATSVLASGLSKTAIAPFATADAPMLSERSSSLLEARTCAIANAEETDRVCSEQPIAQPVLI